MSIPWAAHWYIYRKVQETGFRYKSPLTLPGIWWEAYLREYAKVYEQFGWPAWPLHVVWVGLLIGIPLLLLGISKL